MLRHTFLFMTTLLSIANPSYAAEKWPANLPLAQAIFTQGQNLYTFLGSGGVQWSGATPQNLQEYQWLEFSPPWKSGSRCGSSAHFSGFVHTVPYTVEQDDGLTMKVAIPVSLRFEGKFDAFRKSQILNQPFIQVSVLNFDFSSAVNSPVPYEPGEIKTPFAFRVRELCELGAQCSGFENNASDPLKLAFNGVLRAGHYQLKKGDSVTIRVEWSPQAICDEDSSSFSIGDQIRILQSDTDQEL